jgi:hypothetical protein
MSGGIHPEGSRKTGLTWSLAGCLSVGTVLGVTFSVLPLELVILDAINEQTQLRASVFRCGNGSTLVWGSSVGRIRINTPTQRVAQSTL